MNLYRLVIRPLLFLLAPEQAHSLTFSFLEFLAGIPGMPWLLRKMFAVGDARLQREVAGMAFPNPVGLAAGFDKNAKHLKIFSLLGFGFVEVGTVTPLPQPGNKKPRLFRLPADQAMINRMGFNNDGVDVVAARIALWRKESENNSMIVGGNIGRNKATSNEAAVHDYIRCFERLFDVVDYFAVNVSSPNTPGLRSLQDKEFLEQLLQQIQSANRRHDRPKPVFLKIAPDLTGEQVDEVCDTVLKTGIAGVIATNTTVERKDLRTDWVRIEKAGGGGLSGRPLKKRSNEIVRLLSRRSAGRFAVIGAGGISTPADALEKVRCGALLVQVYTGYVYYGPRLVKDILIRMLQPSSQNQRPS